MLGWLGRRDDPRWYRPDVSVLDLDTLKSEFESRGYARVPGFLSAVACDRLNDEALEFYAHQGVNSEDAARTMNFHQESATARALLRGRPLLRILGTLLEAAPRFLQSIYFYRGSEQPLHSDYLYMSTEPPLQLCGVWIACEDVTEDNGPLCYSPGSHHMPITTVRERYERKIGEIRRRIESDRAALEEKYAGRRKMTGESLETCVFFDDWLNEIIAGREAGGYPLETFLAKKGDLLVWHANLMHGGLPINDPDRSRRSLVAHYLTRAVRTYYDMNYVDLQNAIKPWRIDTSRPAVLQRYR